MLKITPIVVPYLFRVHYGSSYVGDGRSCRAAHRFSMDPFFGDHFTGFRTTLIRGSLAGIAVGC